MRVPGQLSKQLEAVLQLARLQHCGAVATLKPIMLPMLPGTQHACMEAAESGSSAPEDLTCLDAAPATAGAATLIVVERSLDSSDRAGKG